MAATNISLRDWLAGWIVPNPTTPTKGTVGILGTTPVDSLGAEYNAANPMPVSAANIATVDTGNSSAANLGNAGVFTGAWRAVQTYGSITASVFANQNSGTNGFVIQQSSDGVNADFTDAFTVTASSGKTVTIPRQAAFMRVVYTNGATPQTVFRLQTILNAPMPAPSAVKPADGTTFENDFQETLGVNLVSNGTTGDIQRAVVNGQNTTGTGIAAAGILAQFDDVTPGTVTENQFAPLRMASTRALYVQEGPFAYGRVTADGQIKSGAGFLHSITVAGLTATPTAGLLTVYDSLTETGTVIYAEWIFATVTGHTVLLDVPFATGLFCGFDATLANAQATFSYR